MSLLKKTNGVAPVDNVDTNVTAPDDLRSQLGLVGRFRVDMAENRAKADAARKLAVLSAEISCDIGRQALEQKASLIKSTLVAQAVPALAAISTEMLSRHGQAVLQMSVVRQEGFKQQLVLRHEMLGELEALAAQGMLTAEELAEAKAIIRDNAASDIGTMMTATQRALNALEAHAARATDHIARQIDGTKLH